MKSLKRITISVGFVGLLTFINLQANAQSYKIGVYISGYVGEKWNGGNLWETRGIPDNWYNMFDLSINLDREVAGVLRKAKSQENKVAQIMSNANIHSSITPQLTSAVQKLPNTGSSVNVQFILIGHGAVGGLLARYIGGGATELGLDIIRNPLSGDILAKASYAVVTVGTPNQGLPLVEAVNDNISGFRNIEPKLTNFENTLHDALTTKLSNAISMGGLILGIALAISSALSGNIAILYAIATLPALGGFVANTYLNQEIKKNINGLPGMLRSNYYIAQGVLSGKTILDKNNLSLKTLLGPDRGNGAGTLIRKANNIGNPDYYRSVIGAEKSPTPMRIIPEFLNEPGKEEPEYLEFYKLAKQLCQFQGDAWQSEANTAAAVGLGIFNRGTVNRCKDRRDRWRAGLRELKNMNSTWGYIIGSYRYETRTGTRRVYDPNKCSSRGAVLFPTVYDIEGKEADLRIAPIDDPNCDPWVTETYTYTVQVPLKNDGVFSPEYGVWKKGTSPYNKNAHNYYYDDSGDGGYNDLELMRYRRNYTEGANKKGELAKPMRETREWLENEVL